MKIKRNIVICMFTFLLTLQFVSCDFSCNSEKRRNFQNGIRDNARKLDRFHSSKRLNFETHGVLDKRKSYSENYLKNFTNESPTESNSKLRSLSKAMLSVSTFRRNNVNEGRPDLNDVSYFKQNSRLINENQQILSTKLRYAITKTQFPNTDSPADGNQIEDTLVAYRRYSVRRNNRIDRRMANEKDNRLSLNVRENRFREQSRSSRLAVSGKFNNGRFLPAKPTKYTHISNLQSTMQGEASDFMRASLSRKHFPESRRDQLDTSSILRESSKKNSLQQRNNVFERVSVRYRSNVRSQSQKSEISLSRPDLLSKSSRLRHDRHQLVPRRELKIPTDETRMVENARSSRKSVENNFVREEYSDRTILQRRNGRGFRGRFEMRNYVRGRESTFNIRIRNYQNKQSIERKVESFVFDQVAEPQKRQNSIHRIKDNLSSDSRIRSTLTRRITDSYQTHRHYDTQSFAGIGKTNNELRSIRRQVGRFSNCMRNILKNPNDLSNGRRSSEENHRFVRQEYNSNYAEKRLSRNRNQNRIVRNRELPERQTIRKSATKVAVRDLDNRKELNTIPKFDKLFTLDSDMPFRKKRTHLYANTISNENRIQDKRSQTANRHMGRKTNIATRRQFVQQNRFNVDQLLVQVKPTNVINRLDRHTRNTETSNRITFQQHFKDNGFLLQQNARELKQTDRRIAITNRRVASDQYNVFRMNKYLHTREHNRRVRTQSKAHRLEDSNRKEINNKARVYSKRISGDTYGTKDLIGYPKQRMGSENTRALHIRDNLKTLKLPEDRKNGEQGRRDRTRLTWKSVKSALADSMENIPFVESDINRFVAYSKTRGVFERMAPIKDLTSVSETPSINQRRVNNEFIWAFSEYLLSKQSDVLSFVFNLMLGLAVIVAVSDDMNKGFISRRKNQFINCILRYSPVPGTEF